MPPPISNEEYILLHALLKIYLADKNVTAEIALKKYFDNNEKHSILDHLIQVILEKK